MTVSSVACFTVIFAFPQIMCNFPSTSLQAPEESDAVRINLVNTSWVTSFDY